MKLVYIPLVIVISSCHLFDSKKEPIIHESNGRRSLAQEGATTGLPTLEEIEESYSLKVLPRLSKDDFTVYRATNDHTSFIVGVGVNGEIFEGEEILQTSHEPYLLAHWLLEIYIAPGQRPATRTHIGFMDLIEEPKKEDDKVVFYSQVKGKWIYFSWDLNTQVLSQKDMTKILQEKHTKEASGDPICARNGLWCGCWGKNPICYRSRKLDQKYYHGEATHRRLAFSVGSPEAYVICTKYSCSSGVCYQCSSDDGPCTATCPETPRPSDCVFENGVCREVAIRY